MGFSFDEVHSPALGSASGAVVVVAACDARGRAERTVRLAGGAVGDTLDWANARPWLEEVPLATVLLVDAEGVDDATLAAVLPRIDGWARTSAASVVIMMTLAQVDLVTALLAGPRVHWLCDAGEHERVGALATARVSAAGGLHDPAQDPEHAARLARLAAEVARIAETLAGLADEGGRGAVGERRRRWGAPPGDVALAVSAEDVRAAIRARRLRDQLFGAGWFEDPAWDVLLDLFAAELEGTDVSVSSLCIAAAVAPTTALRWIARMEEAALIERRPDPRDRRRMFTGLSADARALMRRYWAAAAPTAA